MKTVRLTSEARMSNSGYHREGKPNWWARIGSGATARFLEIGRVRGDEQLDVEVSVDDGVTEIEIGCGKGSKDKIRETVEV